MTRRLVGGTGEGRGSGVLPSLPRARRRIGGPAEACDERGGRPRPLVGCRPRSAARGPRASRRIADLGDGASGESENRPRPAAFSWFRFLRSLSSRFLDLA